MAYVSVPKDIRQMKNRSLLKFSKRQAVVYGISFAIATPVFFIVFSVAGTQPAVIALVLTLIPGFFISMYEKDGIPPEKWLKYYIRRRYFHPAKRLYRVEKIPAKIRKGDVIGGNTKKGFAAHRETATGEPKAKVATKRNPKNGTRSK